MEPTAAPAPVKKIGKLRASYLLATESFELFRKDKEIAWFVVWNIVLVFLVGIVFLVGFFALLMGDVIVMPAEGEEASVLLQVFGYAILFAFYLITSYITTFYGVALTSVVSARLEGEDKGFSDGMRIAGSRAGRIFTWSLLASTVGVIFQVIADKAGWAGKLFSWLGGVAWGVATFFIVPVIAREDANVAGSVKRSSEIFVKTWGETLIMNFSLGLFFGMLHLVLLIAVFILGAFLFPQYFLLGLLLIGYVVVVVVLAVVQTVLESVFKVVLYEYATRGTVPDSFTPELIMGALTKKAAPVASV